MREVNEVINPFVRRNELRFWSCPFIFSPHSPSHLIHFFTFPAPAIIHTYPTH